MYYDVIASLPHLPHFERAERLPIPRLRLRQRLRHLRPTHAGQLARAYPLLCWRPDRTRWGSDAEVAGEHAALLAAGLERPLAEYAGLRMDQRTLLAALRHRRDGRAPAEGLVAWGVGPRVPHIARHWSEPDFGLAYVYPWLPRARELLEAGDASGLDRLAMQVAWRWLERCAEGRVFGFEAIVSYAFRWDMLEAWLACDASRAKTRFSDLIDKVVHVEED